MMPFPPEEFSFTCADWLVLAKIKQRANIKFYTYEKWRGKIKRLEVLLANWLFQERTPALIMHSLLEQVPPAQPSPLLHAG